MICFVPVYIRVYVGVRACYLRFGESNVKFSLEISQHSSLSVCLSVSFYLSLSVSVFVSLFLSLSCVCVSVCVVCGAYIFLSRFDGVSAPTGVSRLILLDI